MTREGLHAKSDIAAELGWRDMEIDRLRAHVADTDGAITVLGFQNAELRARVAELESNDGDCFTGMLVEIDGHTYGLRPGAARVVREALLDAGRLRDRVAELRGCLARVHNCRESQHLPEPLRVAVADAVAKDGA